MQSVALKVTTTANVDYRSRLMPKSIQQEEIRANGGRIVCHIPQPPRCNTRHPNTDVQCLGDYVDCIDPAVIEVEYRSPETGQLVITRYCEYDAKKHGWL